MPRTSRARAFTYESLERHGSTLTCTYRCDQDAFCESATFEGLELEDAAPAVDAICELYFLLAGLSYYKTGAAERIDAPDLELGEADLALLRGAIDGGLGEFAYRNRLRLDDVELPTARGRHPVAAPPPRRGPLIPFGGGIDSIVTVATATEDDAALFVVAPPTGRYAAIERPAARTGLEVVRCTRALDPSVLAGRSDWFDGHVPVTAVVSALALVGALARGHDEVRMSNERSSSSPTVQLDGRTVNHQWSKSLECEQLLAAAAAARVAPCPTYRSELRSRSELWVAREFSRHGDYLFEFMSCNRAFRQSPDARATSWCGECDKCLFTDLVLAPFLDRATLEAVFGGREPLGDPARSADLEVLVGVGAGPRPFECVGDAAECAAALVAAASRPDRAGQSHLAAIAARCAGAPTVAELLGDDVEVAGAARDRL